MTQGEDGLPAAGNTARTLGVRAEWDILVDVDGFVRPGEGGMSVTPDDPMNLPRSRRPVELDGKGRDPTWSISQEDLGPNLSYRPDPRMESHGFIEPARKMTFDDYQESLHQSRWHWTRIT